MSETKAPMWFEALPEDERRDCAAGLTDAYFAALSTGAWSEFHVQVRQWLDRAAATQLVTA